MITVKLQVDTRLLTVSRYSGEDRNHQGACMFPDV